MTKKYIELEQVNEVINAVYTVTKDINVMKVFQQIKDLPATDIIEKRHGTWKDKNGGRWIFCPMCSECEEAFYEMPVNLKGEIVHNYCPNCGSKLEIDKNYNKDK